MVNEFLSEHWVLVYGLTMYVLGVFSGYWKGKKLMEELIRRIRGNKYLTRNETDFIIKALEENSSLHKQVNMWQSEHAKRVLELGKLREGIKLTREEIENEVEFGVIHH